MCYCRVIPFKSPIPKSHKSYIPVVFCQAFWPSLLHIIKVPSTGNSLDLTHVCTGYSYYLAWRVSTDWSCGGRCMSRVYVSCIHLGWNCQVRGSRLGVRWRVVVWNYRLNHMVQSFVGRHYGFISHHGGVFWCCWSRVTLRYCKHCHTLYSKKSPACLMRVLSREIVGGFEKRGYELDIVWFGLSLSPKLATDLLQWYQF